MAAFRDRDAARCRLIGPFRHLAAWAAESRRGHGLALAAIGARPDRVVHALQRDQAAAAVANGGADLDVELLGFRQGAPNDAIGLFQRQSHSVFLTPVCRYSPRSRL